MTQLSVETGNTFATLLELAADNDIERFENAIESDPSGIDKVGLWYGRQKRSKQMVLEHRTPLMVAALYGSIDVLRLIILRSKANVNRLCGVDATTALHCAASGGSLNAFEAIKLLLFSGADPNLIDVNGLRPVDVIAVSPEFPGMKKTLEELLGVAEGEITILPLSEPELENDPEPKDEPELDPGLDLDLVCNDPKRECPIEASFPDIKNRFYSTDEFRMYSFKVQTCSLGYSHDWTECPFVHPGEYARRRDPQKYHYSCFPCPHFRKAACREGDMCKYAHGVFECWLHPAQYRTRLCRDGLGCNRPVCFFAHTRDQLRQSFVSKDPVVRSPRSAAGPSSLDFNATMRPMPGMGSGPVPGPGPGPSFTPPQSPTTNCNWAQPNVPSLHLPGSDFHSSRLRSSLNALAMDPDLNIPLLNELNRQRRTILTPTRLDDVFAAESLSPSFYDQPVFSPRRNSSGFNQFQHQQSMFSTINTNYSPKHPVYSVQSQHQFRSLSSRELGSRSDGVMGATGFGVDPWSNWGSGNEKAWDANANAGIETETDTNEFGKLRRSLSFEIGGNNRDEPDVSWVQSVVKETSSESETGHDGSGGSDGGRPSGESGSGGVSSNTQVGQMDQSEMSAWIGKMQL